MSITPTPFSENGGFSATTFFLFVPAISLAGQPFVAIYDTTSFDDPDDAASYSWRAEDIAIARVPTVRRVIFIYHDLGPVSITVTMSGTNDLGNVVSVSSKVKLGTSGASGALLTAFVDLQLTAFRPQLSVSRAAGAGPLSIISATLIGEVEEVSL